MVPERSRSPDRLVAARRADARAAACGVGVGELLAAHRALAAVDPRRRARRLPRAARGAVLVARRPARCSTRRSRRASARRTPALEPLEPPAAIERLGAAARRRPGAGRPARRASRSAPVPPPGARRSCCASKDFAEYTRRRARAGAPAARAAGPARAAAALAAHPADARRRGDVPTCAPPSARRCATAASRSSAAGASRRRARAGSCSCATCPARWRPTRGCCSSTCRRAWPPARRVEAFVFGTRLTRVTRELRGRDPDRALARAAATVEDWSGGTRIGAALAELNREHGRRIGRGAVVVVALRRLGPRRPGRAGARDGAPAPLRSPLRLAQPAQGRARLRAAHPRDGARRFRTLTISWPGNSIASLEAAGRPAWRRDLP